MGEHLDNNPLVNLTQLPMGGVWQVVFTIMCLEWLTTYAPWMMGTRAMGGKKGAFQRAETAARASLLGVHFCYDQSNGWSPIAVVPPAGLWSE